MRDHPLRILVVDDCPDNRESMARFLNIFGYEVLGVHDGPAALNELPLFQPDVVLLDIGLPGMDGWEVARRIRQQEGLSRLLVLAVSGYGRDVDKARSREAGFDAHLTKPADLKELTRLLKSRAETASL